ncbi:Transaldolase [Psilocybe cubensis]|uniref:Transaldolase n=2 Tax=Psilocybe cubensis TaxID=181762 RepID=A0ACB8GNX8_PSICU|nr:Transaldolase [Psilocybe cubensis]KAH9477180.1 Transaldolase [Psilocybe cubensis]
MPDCETLPTFNALDAVHNRGIIIASDGAEYEKIAKFSPVDATTNPSLVFAAVSTAKYSYLIDDAVTYSLRSLSPKSPTVDEIVELALDHLLVRVGAEILSIIPGRVSISVDPRLGFSYAGILSKSRALIKLVEELHIPRTRILIKIPATPEGIHAAHTLESVDGIHTNLTLIFSLVQAIACAQAGVSVVSPFIGRVKDWWSARAIAEGNPSGLDDQPLQDHPGIALVRRIKETYTRCGYSTQIMAAGFRKPEEIVELSRYGKKGGADLVTLPPDLLEGLMKLDGNLDLRSDSTQPTPLTELPNPPPIYFSPNGPTHEGAILFERDSKQEAISLDKVPEGLAKFSIDAVKLETMVRDRVQQFAHARLPDVVSITSDVFQESRGRLPGDGAAVSRRRKSVSVN